MNDIMACSRLDEIVLEEETRTEDQEHSGEELPHEWVEVTDNRLTYPECAYCGIEGNYDEVPPGDPCPARKK